MVTINLLIASQIKGGKSDRYQTLQIKTIIRILVKITDWTKDWQKNWNIF